MSNGDPISFLLTKTAFEHCPEFLKGLADATCGGVVVFHGRVREHNQGRRIISIYYEAYPALCQSVGESILREAIEKFGIKRARCYHRWGRLSVGDVAICVAVAGTHRRESFAAAQFIMGEIKKRLPIWKKETDVEGRSEWIVPEPPNDEPSLQEKARAPHNGFIPSQVKVDFEPQDLYRRQLTLPQIGPQGQKQLARSRVLIIGAGGLGCPASLSLVQAGVGVVGVCDFDTVAADNLHRQGLYTAADVGLPKADVAALRLNAHNPFVKIEVHRQRVEPDNIENLIRDYDLILDATDSLQTKFLINDACVLLRKPVIQAAVHRFCAEAFMWHPEEPHGCLRCRFPEIPPPSLFADCSTAGVIGVVPNMIGHMQALWALQCLLGQKPAAIDRLFVFDFETMQYQSYERKALEDCPVCGLSPTITSLDDRHYTPMIVDDLETDPDSWIKSSEAVWIDLREDDEQRRLPIEGLPRLIHKPFSQFDQWAQSLDPQTTYLLFCCAGMRSRKAAQHLREKGCRRVYSINGGAQRIHKALHDHASAVA